MSDTSHTLPGTPGPSYLLVVNESLLAAADALPLQAHVDDLVPRAHRRRRGIHALPVQGHLA